MNRHDLKNQGIPPETSGVHAVVSTTTSNAAAAAWDWVTDVGATNLPGPVWVRVIAQTNDATIRFRSDNAAGTTLTNGIHIVQNGHFPIMFYVDPVRHRYIDHISQTGAGTLQLHVCSKIGARNYIN